MLGAEWHWLAWGRALSSVRSGQPAFRLVHGQDLFAYLEQHPDAGASYDQAMASTSRLTSQAVVSAYDFSGFQRLVDVGGGYGQRTIEILRAHPRMRAILLDRPSVVERARSVLAEAGLGDRCELVPGSFLESVPAGGDCHLLSAVIANWDDDHALTILRNCRQAIPDTGRLLIFEPVLPEGSGPHLAKTLDLIMLVVLGGRVRTPAEHGELLAAAGFRLTRLVTTAGPFAVVEAHPA
jgi:hypothetical protein